MRIEPADGGLSHGQQAEAGIEQAPGAPFPAAIGDLPPVTDPGPPGRLAYAAELRSLGELQAFRRQRLQLIRELPQWPSRHVLVLPGLLSGDWATAPMRGVLSAIGHKVEGWQLGRNMGLRPGRFEQLESRFLTFSARAREPVALIGWSLGGLYAVELARRHPQEVRQVITMGSPVSGLLTANNAWKLYERVAGHALQSAPVDWQPGALPMVPFTAIAALGDGIVHPKAAHARPGPEVENLHVPGTHSGLGWNPHAIRLVADRLARR
ncbi:alpha/beta hydrolase [Sandaracinobacter neustonicus]|uniref:Alpha/beta hydrolase n=1 Tax=Sandaracinobacter neustonicus TaxID=1715348 RepID=A0A501XNM7_9SPHN|nr:alpha/beta fold hydrolase [Sandaracinobacter neustonicus]TPE61757.1 alpha/beta hydrolase [Sandaracinobacter neustonicus]